MKQIARLYFLHFIVFVIILHPVVLKAFGSVMPSVLEQYIQILKSGEKMAAYKAAADLADTSYSHPLAAKIILEFAVKPETPEGTRIFLFRAYARQMKMLNLTGEGVQTLAPLLGQFGRLTDPVMEALIILGPKSLPHLAKGLSCSTSGLPKDDNQAQIIITRAGLSASTINAIASTYPDAPEIDEIADALMSCLECGPENAALLCVQTFPRVTHITQDHKKRLAALIQSSPYLLLKIYSAQLLGRLHQTDPNVITTLEETLKTPDEGVKFSAAYALAKYVSGHKQALKALLSISKSENKELKEYATGAVEKFGASRLAEDYQLKNTVKNSLGMTFVYIPPGSFMMGSAISAEEVEKKYGGYASNYEDEQPQHMVRLTKGFYLSQTEVTVGQWRQFAKDTGYKIETNVNTFIYYNNGWQWMSGIFWDKPLFPQTDEHPVTCISWDDAQIFIKWLSGKENIEYRLPTEAEWEYACRAGSTNTKFWGDNSADACKYANVRNLSYWKNSFDCEDGYEFTAPVGQYRANNFGLYDMLGNVAEFCQDRYGNYPSGSVSDPQGPSKGFLRVVRGGGWFDPPRTIRAAERAKISQDFRTNLMGFRVLRAE